MKFSDVEKYSNFFLDTMTNQEVSDYDFSLITDRTQSDVNRWDALRKKGSKAMTDEEKEEWLAGMKGAYTATDLNRVGGAFSQVSDFAVALLNGLLAYQAEKGVADADIFRPYEKADAKVYPKTDWVKNDIPTPAQESRYLNNVEILRSLLPLQGTLPPIPDDLEDLSYTEANDIETILMAVYDALVAFWALSEERIDYIGDYRYQLVSGTFYAGNNRTLQHYSRGR